MLSAAHRLWQRAWWPPFFVAERQPTGREFGPTELPEPAEDTILAIGTHTIFYAALGPHGNQYLRQQAIPSACPTH